MAITLAYRIAELSRDFCVFVEDIIKKNLKMGFDSEENTSRQQVVGSPMGLMLTVS